MGNKSIIAMLVIVLGAAGGASAQGEASYGGVTPGSEGAQNLPPKVEEIPEGALMLTWPGFMMQEDGGSVFFVQTSKPVEVTTKKGVGTFELVLRRTQVHLKNNLLPLETQFFRTPVTRATVQPKGKTHLVMVFEMREDVTPTVTQEKAKDGFNYVFVKFPP